MFKFFGNSLNLIENYVHICEIVNATFVPAHFPLKISDYATLKVNSLSSKYDVEEKKNVVGIVWYFSSTRMHERALQCALRSSL